MTSIETDAVMKVLQAKRLVMGPAVAAFEKSLASFVGRKHAVAVNSGTAALQAALMVREISAAHPWTVFVPAYTWVATYNAPKFAGAKVVLVDTRTDTFNMCMKSLQRAVEQERKSAPDRKLCVMPVHMFGYRCGHERDEPNIQELARSYNMEIIGDAGCGFGFKEDGMRCGAWNEIECTSFHPRKVLTAGEGGAVFTDCDEVAARLKRVRDHGAHRTDDQRAQTTAGGVEVPLFPERGLNFRMTEMQGALGHAQMSRVDWICERRRQIASFYDSAIEASSVLKSVFLTPVKRTGPNDDRVLTAYTVRLIPDALRGSPSAIVASAAKKEFRRLMVQTMAQDNVALRPPMISLTDVPYVMEDQRAQAVTGDAVPLFSGAIANKELTIGLPIFPDLTSEQIELVMEKLEAFCRSSPAQTLLRRMVTDPTM